MLGAVSGCPKPAQVHAHHKLCRVGSLGGGRVQVNSIWGVILTLAIPVLVRAILPPALGIYAHTGGWSHAPARTVRYGTVRYLITIRSDQTNLAGSYTFITGVTGAGLLLALHCTVT